MSAANKDSTAPEPTSLPAQNADPEAGPQDKPATNLALARPSLATRPARLLRSITAWLRNTWLDTLTIFLCLLAAMLLYLFVPLVFPRQFPYNASIKQSAWGMKHGKPKMDEYITTVQSAIQSFVVPAGIMVLIGPWFVREMADVSAVMMGLGYASATSTLFQVMVKVFIGGLRPYFLSVCHLRLPDQVNGISVSNTAETLWLNVSDHCNNPNGHELKEAQMSFPSGHATAAFSGFGFLALWLNGKLKIFGQGRRSGFSLRRRRRAAKIGEMVRSGKTGGRIQHWKLIPFVAAYGWATVVAGSKVRDNAHHPADVLFGALIGTLFAHIAYRMVYRSVYDWRDNHIPQERNTVAAEQTESDSQRKD